MDATTTAPLTATAPAVHSATAASAMVSAPPPSTAGAAASTVADGMHALLSPREVQMLTLLRNLEDADEEDGERPSHEQLLEERSRRADDPGLRI